jgi:hypothetical protein
MLVLSDKGNKLMDAKSVFVSPIIDRENKENVLGYYIKAYIDGRSEVIARRDTEKEAKDYVKKLADLYDVQSL